MLSRIYRRNMDAQSGHPSLWGDELQPPSSVTDLSK